MSAAQYGFRKGRSTVDCLTLFVHQMTTRLDRDKKAVAVFFDLKAAFDTVPHGPLLRKLQHSYDIPNIILRWLQSYLSGRSYAVRVNGVCSSTRPVPSGVPQGSCVGPTLFIAYIDGLNSLHLSSGSECLCYADDLVLYKSIKSAQDELDLQQDINKISQFIKSLHLQLNTNKTKYLVFGRHSSPPSLSLCLAVDQVPIESVDFYKYLGVYFDRKLSFSHHSDISAKSAAKAIGTYNTKFSMVAPKHVFETIYHSCIVHALLSSSEAWWPQHGYTRCCVENMTPRVRTCVVLCRRRGRVVKALAQGRGLVMALMAIS
ncbi:MAG: reverse transcriptase family protein [Gammaproteobacteria bacterium]|nr:reverse transcriptase family protein [Gammaproteobacteria bacterium]